MIETLQSVGGFAVGLILPFLFVLMLIVAVHEFGHYWVARLCGVAVESFSIGFGPEIIGRTDRNGTRWKLAAIPLGGYVKFLGDENVASASGREALAAIPEDRRNATFAGKPVWQRALIVAAGPMANFILGILIMAALFVFYGRETIEPVVGGLTEDAAALSAGIAPGDRILSANGVPVVTFEDVRIVTMGSAGDPVTLVVDRAGETLEFTVTPKLDVVTGSWGSSFPRWLLGITPDPNLIANRPVPLPEAIVAGADQIWLLISETGAFFGRLIQGRESMDQLGGPATVARLAAESAELGFGTLISFVAAISVSIGLVNLLPIPLLDGGHLLFYAFEAVRRRALSPRTQEIALRIGALLLLALMTVALGNDFGLL